MVYSVCLTLFKHTHYIAYLLAMNATIPANICVATHIIAWVFGPLDMYADDKVIAGLNVAPGRRRDITTRAAAKMYGDLVLNTAKANTNVPMNSLRHIWSFI
jgi:hypothetical protein